MFVFKLNIINKLKSRRCQIENKTTTVKISTTRKKSRRMAMSLVVSDVVYARCPMKSASLLAS